MSRLENRDGDKRKGRIEAMVKKSEIAERLRCVL